MEVIPEVTSEKISTKTAQAQAPSAKDNSPPPRQCDYQITHQPTNLWRYQPLPLVCCSCGESSVCSLGWRPRESTDHLHAPLPGGRPARHRHSAWSSCPLVHSSPNRGASAALSSSPAKTSSRPRRGPTTYLRWICHPRRQARSDVGTAGPKTDADARECSRHTRTRERRGAEHEEVLDGGATAQNLKNCATTKAAVVWTRLCRARCTRCRGNRSWPMCGAVHAPPPAAPRPPAAHATTAFENGTRRRRRRPRRCSRRTRRPRPYARRRDAEHEEVLDGAPPLRT